jgi:cytochrome c556
MKRILGIALLLAACGPKKQVQVNEIATMKDLGDVMKVQAQAMDPLFKKADQTSFTDDEWMRIADSAARIAATTTKVKEFSKGKGFDDLDMQLADQARKLGDAAQAKNAADAAKLLGEMKATCKSCHKQFR